jgi:hypothetical protein
MPDSATAAAALGKSDFVQCRLRQLLSAMRRCDVAAKRRRAAGLDPQKRAVHFLLGFILGVNVRRLFRQLTLFPDRFF